MLAGKLMGAGGGVVVPDYGTNLAFTVETTASTETFTIGCKNIAGTWNATIDWGDGGSTSEITAYNDADLSHVYASAGTYLIQISGSLPSLAMIYAGAVMSNKVRTVENFGSVGMTSMYGAFFECKFLTRISAYGTSDTSAVTTMVSTCSRGVLQS
jgi:hypothetical protein